MSVRKKLAGALLGATALTLISGQALAQDAKSSDDDWEFGAAIYMWGPKITANTSGGREAQLPFYNILDNLQFAAMAALEARKDEWSIVTDMIYLDLKDDVNKDRSFPGGRDVTIDGSIELKSWVVTPTVRYLVSDNEEASVNLLAGVRYLYLDTIAEVYFDQDQVLDAEESGANWDGIIGAQADFKLNDRWYIPTYVDVGTGDSKSTWQFMVGVGYRFDKFDLRLSYRYLNWDFDNDSPLLDKLNIKGPLAGVIFRF